jgi:hypothetical protein
MGERNRTLWWIRFWIGLFVAGLVVSGATALPLMHEVEWLAASLGVGDAVSPEEHTGLAHWVLKVRDGLRATYTQYPFMAYGTDWLAFGHFVIAIFFLGPLRDPVRNVWVIRAGLVACALVIPWALIWGAVREIPFFWRLIDCSFGVIGFVPLWFALRLTRKLEGRLSEFRKTD